MKKIFYIIIVLILLIFTVVLTIENTELTKFGFFSKYYQIPVSILAISCMAFGLFVGVLLFLPDLMVLRKLKKQIDPDKLDEGKKENPKPISQETKKTESKNMPEPTSVSENKNKKKSDDPFNDPELDELLNM